MLKALGLGVANNPRQSDRTPTTDIVRVQRAQAPPLSMHISTSTIFELRTTLPGLHGRCQKSQDTPPMSKYMQAWPKMG